MRRVAWDDAEWFNPPAEATVDGDELRVVTRSGSDLWRVTSYGFVRDSGHALLVDLPDPGAVEVTFRAELPQLYDQAGLLVRADETRWVKAGVERSDGELQVGAVVTHECSDWSLAAVPGWQDRAITIRASRVGDAVTVRARAEGEPWRLVRLAPFPAGRPVQAGPMCCSPQSPGARVRFSRFAVGPPDPGLHEPPP